MALNPKQKKALELLTCGLGLSFKEIAEQSGVTYMTIWKWRNEEQYKEFQEELKRLNEIRWQAAEDAARESCISLCREGNQRMVEFVMKNLGYNPSQKIEQVEGTTIKVSITDSDGDS